MAHVHHTRSVQKDLSHFAIGQRARLEGDGVYLDNASTCIAALLAALLAAPPQAEGAIEKLFRAQAEREGLDADDIEYMLMTTTLTTDEDDDDERAHVPAD